MLILRKKYETATKAVFVQFMRNCIDAIESDAVSSPEHWGVIAAHMREIASIPELGDFTESESLFNEGLHHGLNADGLNSMLQEGIDLDWSTFLPPEFRVDATKGGAE